MSKSPPPLPTLQKMRDAALKALGEVQPAGSAQSSEEARSLMLSSRTNGGRQLPPYYLVYFLLVDLLQFYHMGHREKSAWTVPVRYRGRLYGIEHRKMGLGVFAPSLDSQARMSGKPTEEQEADAKEIVTLITKAVVAATPYFEWRAEQAAAGNQLNVQNKGSSLFERYEYFRDRFKALTSEAESRKGERHMTKKTLSDGTEVTTGFLPSYSLHREAKWNAQAAIEAFFSWTEHVFIHIAILQGKLRTGKDVAKLAGSVPVLLTDSQRHRYSLTGKPAFDETWAINEIEIFIEHLWSGTRAPAKHHFSNDVPTILTFVDDGTYTQAMSSEESMEEFIEQLTNQFDRAADMDW